MRTVTSDIIIEKNKRVNAPIHLYELYYTTTDILYYTDYDIDYTFTISP